MKLDVTCKTPKEEILKNTIDQESFEVVAVMLRAKWV